MDVSFALACVCSLMVLLSIIMRVNSHGRLLEPPSRASMWRVGFDTPKNYDDNQLYCGGKHRLWDVNGGKCGVCGDPWDGTRENEAGGKYATGIISRNYTEGQTINVEIEITASHLGHFEFRLCRNNNPLKAVSQSCLDKILLQQPNGSSHIMETGKQQKYKIRIVLPVGITCSQCVFQWQWITGNSWGCSNGNSHCCKGCGPQEQFYGCSDIRIDNNPLLHTNDPSSAVVIISQVQTLLLSSFVILMIDLMHSFI